MSDSIFTKIINREVPADIVYEDEQFICIKDIAPRAPVHLLIIPKEPIESIGHMKEEHVTLMGNLMLTAKKVAAQEELEHFRLVFNTGAEAGQTVFHLHGHLLSGRDFSESSI